MIKRKQGITVAMVVTMVLVIMLLTTTITISVSSTLKSSRLRAFATELSNIQDTIDTYIRTTSSVDYVLNDVIVTPPAEILTTQFRGETVTNGTVILHVIDLDNIGIEKSVYGKSKTVTDVYAVSFDTGKVYYVQGYDASDVVYYTLTEELENLLSGEQGNNVISNNVIFVPSVIGWSKNPIQVLVKVPTTIDISTVNITTSVASVTTSSSVLNGSYNEITVNTGNYVGNYTITVKYTLDGGIKMQTYEVANYDGIAPVITFGKITTADKDTTYKYLNDIVVTDEGIVKKIMYAGVELTLDEAKTYFTSNGKTVLNNKIRLNEETKKYTIYAEDYAGNASIITVIIPNVGDLVEYTPTADPNGKYLGAKYVKDTVSTSSTYNTYIESTIDTYTPGNMTWVYLGQDENGNILLTSRETTTFTMTIAGQDGWVTGPDRMDSLCNTLYGNSTYGIARNMKIEDVNRTLGYPGETGYLGSYNNQSGTLVNTPTAKTIGELETELGKKLSNRKTPRKLPPKAFEDYLSDYYIYTGTEYKSSTTDEYKLIFNKNNSTTKLPMYWLSSSSARLDFKDDRANFDMRAVHSGRVLVRNLFYSSGSEYGPSIAIRPVIVLNSNICFGEKNDAGEWTLVEK